MPLWEVELQGIPVRGDIAVIQASRTKGLVWDPSGLTHITFFFQLSSLGSYAWHVEVPRLGVESEMQLTVNATATATSMSATYTTTYRTVRSLTQ